LNLTERTATMSFSLEDPELEVFSLGGYPATERAAQWMALQLLKCRKELAANAATIAAQAAEIERLKDERDHYAASSDRWLEACRKVFKLKCQYRQESYSKDAELAALRSQLEELRAWLDSADRFTFPNGLQITQCSDGSWHTWMPGLPGKFTKSRKEAFDVAIAANWLATHTETEST
jgi:hypothetical protein